MIIRTADELLALDVEGRGKARRAARDASLPKRILRAFLQGGGPIPIDAFAADRHALLQLDAADLIRIRDGHIDIAYPFSAAPTAFTARLLDGTERYTCCATDALGIAPMVGQPVEIVTRCHDCAAPLAFSATPDGPGADAAGVMLWVGARTDERCRSIDDL